MSCPGCGSDVKTGLRFCPRCGTRLGAAACPQCGAATEPGFAFCGECGAALGGAAPPRAAPPAAGPAPGPVLRPEPAAERRLVSVLFADLVGFTPLSEERDPEEVRELLSRYFDTCRQVISRYGGAVEKFIGDAVMAVWGTPRAREDDAERAVRAALELTGAVSALGADIGVKDLRLRAGVVTGEAAITVGAAGQGMVAGDVVNTASRVQSVAPAGAVLVDDVTRRATEAPIAYEDAGRSELKGKTAPMQLWRATRVVAGIRGSMRAAALEPPFVGRDGELRLVKELFHSSAEERRARLVSVIGVAGIGKSRLSWEFEKYIDGLADDVLWHRGRCLSYGESVTYWALAEMVRARADIAEGEDAATALPKLDATLATYVPDADERGWLQPRLAHLLGLYEHTAADPSDLFAAWRLFFERLAAVYPTVLVFEDLQWADSGLIDFVEYVLDWSRAHPLYVMTLARPELAERRPSWGSGKRNFISLYLEPLPPAAMDELVVGMVPGLPAPLRARIRDRAEGVPLYAVETARMLLDRGLLRREGASFTLTGPVGDLDVPETLQALIAARLDALPQEERHLLQDAAVLGQTFARRRLAAVTLRSEDELEPLLAALARKEFLTVQNDPLSPERGQYTFLQALVRKVAYDTLSRHERKQRHLQAATQLETGAAGDLDETVEVVAAHLLEAYRAAPQDADAAEIRERARHMLVRAGNRAASLAAPEDSQRYYEQAAALTDEPLARATLLERAGEMAQRTGRGNEAARRHMEEAIDLFTSADEAHQAARVSAKLGEVMWNLGHLSEAVERMEQSLSVLSSERPDAGFATLAAQLGRFQFFVGQKDRSGYNVERALEIAEALVLPEVLAQALNTKHLLLVTAGRPQEGTALLERALKIALQNDLPAPALRAYFNLADRLAKEDRYAEAVDLLERALALARQRGDRFWEWSLQGQAAYSYYVLGRWDELVRLSDEIGDPENLGSQRVIVVSVILPALALLKRGQVEAAERLIASGGDLEASDDLQDRVAFNTMMSALLRVQGRYAEALRHALVGETGRETMGPGEVVQEAMVEAVEAALALRDLSTVAALLDAAEARPPGRSTRFERAQVLRLRSREAALRRERDRAEASARRGIDELRDIGTPYWLAVALLEYAQLLIDMQRHDEVGALLRESRELFERLEAAPWVRRVGEAEQAAGLATPAPTPVRAASRPQPAREVLEQAE